VIVDGHYVVLQEAASALALDPEMSRLEQAERYLREGVLVPTGFAERDGTRHEVVKWDPTPVAYSGFMGCVTHSIVVTDRGTFEVGRYPAMRLETCDKVWQWFIHRRIDQTDITPKTCTNRSFCPLPNTFR
jgi:hypothetical protein